MGCHWQPAEAYASLCNKGKYEFFLSTGACVGGRDKTRVYLCDPSLRCLRALTTRSGRSDLVGRKRYRGMGTRANELRTLRYLSVALMCRNGFQAGAGQGLWPKHIRWERLEAAIPENSCPLHFLYCLPRADFIPRACADPRDRSSEQPLQSDLR